VGSTTGDFNDDTLATKVTTVLVVNSVFSITRIGKVHKTISVLQLNVHNVAKTLEKALYIALGGTIRQTTNVDTGANTARHFEVIDCFNNYLS
jgi:hypothetical protein